MTVVFVGSYSPADRPGIRAFAFDAAGGFRPLATHQGITNPSYVARHPSGRCLFAVSETGLETEGAAGSVHSFRIESDPLTTVVTELSRQPSGGDHPCHVAVDGTGSWVAVSNYGSGTISILPIEPDGVLGGAVTLLRHTGSSVRRDRQAGSHAHSATFCGDNRFLLVADLGTDRLVVYDFDDVTGSCRPAFEAESAPGSGPRHVAFHPGGEHCFVVNELDNQLAWWRFDPRAGALQFEAAVPTASDVGSGDLAADVHVSSSGERVYVSNRGPDTIASFAFDPASGLRRLGAVGSGGEWPRSFALTPEGDHLLVANQHSGSVVALPVRTDGGLEGPRARTSVPGASSVVVV